uniref:Uncharacterized protein n=1 Tax=Lygus hesperus TaxID=30085 RepID=A0A146KP72_LYGHE
MCFYGFPVMVGGNRKIVKLKNATFEDLGKAIDRAIQEKCNWMSYNMPLVVQGEFAQELKYSALIHFCCISFKLALHCLCEALCTPATFLKINLQNTNNLVQYIRDTYFNYDDSASQCTDSYYMFKDKLLECGTQKKRVGFNIQTKQVGIQLHSGAIHLPKPPSSGDFEYPPPPPIHRETLETVTSSIVPSVASSVAPLDTTGGEKVTEDGDKEDNSDSSSLFQGDLRIPCKLDVLSGRSNTIKQLNQSLKCYSVEMSHGNIDVNPNHLMLYLKSKWSSNKIFLKREIMLDTVLKRILPLHCPPEFNVTDNIHKYYSRTTMNYSRICF